MRVLHVGWGFYPWRPGGLIAYAEDLMAAQVERGDQVAYFLSGRHYPYLSGPRLKRWRRRGVAMYEVINPPVIAGMELGTRNPELELSEPWMEAAFRRVLTEWRPDVVHIQELHGLPTSLIDLARATAVPTLMTLQDYFPLCATLRLFDAEERICTRSEVGADCVARNADAPRDGGPLMLDTMRFEVGRLRGILGRRGVFVLRRVLDRLFRGLGLVGRPPDESPAAGEPAGEPELARAFQRRRDANIERLGRVDRLVAPSPRLAEIYRSLGVVGDRLITLPFTPSHIEHLCPRALSAPPAPVKFVTLNGCASPSKGSETMRAALRALRAAGAEGSLRLHVFGYVHDDVRDELAGFDGVELHGLYEREELDGLLDGLDVGLVPSMWEEPFPSTGLEMIAKGIPLIANPLGGIVEYAREGETAWLNRSCSGEDLAALMLQLVREPERVLEMHRRLLAVRDELLIPWSPHVDAMDALYREIAPAGSPTASRRPR
jgi:glycosyltransferase involved in cell wall biosynthesis